MLVLLLVCFAALLSLLLGRAEHFTVDHLCSSIERNKLMSLTSDPATSIGASSRGMSWVALPLVLLIVVAAFRLSPNPIDDAVSLPILVYPPDGRSEHVESVTLSVDDPAGVDSLYVQAHQPFNAITGWDKGVADDGFDPEGAAEIRVNGGSWVPIRDENVDCAWPEEAYGCVAGVYHTIRFTIPIQNLESGANTLDFRYNGTKGLRSGYRVLGVGLMTPSDPSVQEFDPHQHGAHDPSQLVQEDVGEWESPEGYRSAEDVQEGEQLWNQQDLLVELDGSDIRASCGSCHAKDGRDLKYFGYSNRVITARSRAHGLSEAEGKKIAAYIRSIDLRKENGSTYEAPGRPWNPPYQPGPSGFGPNGNRGPDEANQVYWAAGAGLDWVLDAPREDPGTERDMLAHFFPENGDPSQGVDWYDDSVTGKRELDWSHISTDSTLNMRSMPVDIQFPDWNNWLPKIHPMDAVPDQFVGGEGQRWYEEELSQALESGNLGSIETATRRMKFELRQDGVLKHTKPSGYSDNKYAISRASTYQWLAVKYWESFHGHHLEDKADEAYCDDGVRPWCEPRGWIGRQRIPFDIAGHISAPSGQQSSPWVYANEAQEKTFSHIWYQVQMVVNPGTQPRSSHQNPVDIGYQRGHIRHSEEMGPPADFRQFQTEIKVWQLHSKSGEVDSDRRGWNAHISRTNFFERVAPGDPELKRAMHTAGMRAWWDQMRRHDIGDFPREKTNPFYWPEDEVPAPSGWTSLQNQGQQTYQYLIESAESGLLPPSLIDSIGTQWGQQMWPETGEPPYDDRPGWDEIADSMPATSQAIPLNEGWNLVSTRVNPANDSLRSLFAEVASDLVVVENQERQAYRPFLDNNTLTTWAPTQAYRVYMNGNQTLTVEGTPLNRSGPIELQKGWNLVPYYSSREMAVSDAYRDLDGVLVMVKDEDGNTFIPGQGINQIGTLQPGRAYKVFVESATSFSYP